jgi:hypothetical protein
MDNQNEKGSQGQTGNPKQATDKGEDAQDRQDTAKRAWQDREGIPRGTPEQGGKSADQVGGSGTTEPTPEIEEDDIEQGRNRRTEDDEEEPVV